MRSLLFDLRMYTMLETQYVGADTFAITPISSILSSYGLTSDVCDIGVVNERHETRSCLW